METLDELVEAVMDIAREQPHDDAAIIIADRIRKFMRYGQDDSEHMGSSPKR